MKKFVIKVLLYLLLIVTIDYSSTSFFDYLKSNAKGGSTKQNEYIANELTTDILILGSSRASHHYDPEIISNSLNLSCYNAGKGGYGILLAYSYFSMILERKEPKVVLYEITPTYDYLEEEHNNYSKYISQLKTYYNKEPIRNIIDDLSSSEEKILLKLNLYRNNSRILPFIIDNIVYRSDIMQNGFSPLYGTMDVSEAIENIDGNNIVEVDNIKIKYLEKLIMECKKKNIKLIFIASPVYQGKMSDEYNFAKELANKHKISFLDFISVDDISGNITFFQDKTHMNIIGAKRYTQYILPQLRKTIEN